MNKFLADLKKIPAFFLEKKKYLVPILALFFIFGFLHGFYRNFELDPFIKPYLFNLEKTSGVKIEYDSAKVGFPLRVNFKGVEIRYHNKKVIEGEEGNLSLSVTSLIFGKKKGSFVLRNEGYIKMIASDNARSLNITVSLKKFHYSSKYEHPYFTFDYSIVAEGDMELHLDKKKITNSQIKGKIELKEVHVEDLKVMDMWKVGDFIFKNIFVQPETEEGKVRFKEMRLKNKDVDGTVELALVLSRKLSLSRLDGKLKVNLMPSFIEKLKKSTGIPLNKREFDVSIRGPLKSPYIRWK